MSKEAFYTVSKAKLIEKLDSIAVKQKELDITGVFCLNKNTNL